MKIIVALLLNAALLAWLLPWLRRQWRAAGPAERLLLALGLGGRLLVGGLRGWHPVDDAGYMSYYGHLLTAQMWQDPAAGLGAFAGNELWAGGASMVFHGNFSNTFFFVKVLALLNLASLDADWLNALYLSAFSFWGCWTLVQAWRRVLPHTPAGAALLAFVAWPSVLFWAAGISKEAVVLGSGAGLLGVFVTLCFGAELLAPARRNWLVGAGLLLALLHFKMRYFFAVPLLAALAGLAGVQLLQRLGVARARWAQALVLAAVLAAGAWLASEISPAFRPNKFTNQVVRIYEHNLSLSLDKPHFEYPNLRPTLASIGRHAPLAAANALTRPWLGDSKQPQYIIAALENGVLLALLALTGWAAWHGRAGRLPFGLALVLVVHCLTLAVLLGLSTPNLGSLHRYRSGLLPYLLLLLLQNDYAAAAMRRLGLR